MKPREFITAVLLWLATSLSVCPGVAFAQSSLPVVAILRATGDESASVNRLFRQAAREIGHEDGRTIRIVEYSAQNDITRLPGLSAVVVAERPAVVVAMGPAAARAMKAASSSVPIVAFTSFPVEFRTRCIACSTRRQPDGREPHHD